MQSPNNYNELHYAIMQNDVDRVKQVLEDNPSLLFTPDAHNVYPIRMAIRFQNIECLNYLIEKYNSKIPIARQCDFVELCMAGTKIVKYFFKRQWVSIASEDHLENDLLKCAVISGDDDVLKLILNYSPDVNKLDEQGYLAISYALGVIPHDVYPSIGGDEEDIIEPPFFFNPKIVRRLLDHKYFDINQGDRWDFTPLMTSLEFKLDKEIINWILEKPNVNVNIQRYTGETALMIAINRNSSKEIIETLLRAGADLNLRNKEDHSAYDLAKNNPHYATDPDFIKKLKPLPLKGLFASRKKMHH